MSYFPENPFMFPAAYGFFAFLLLLPSGYLKTSRAPPKYLQGQVRARATDQFDVIHEVRILIRERINLGPRQGLHTVRRKKKNEGREREGNER